MCVDGFSIRYWALLATCSSVCVLFQLCLCVHWFRSDIGLCRLLVAVTGSLCSVSLCLCVCACVCGLRWLLVAVSLCSVSVVCVCIGVSLGLLFLLVAVSLCSVSVWIRYRATSATCSCQSV